MLPPGTTSEQRSGFKSPLPPGGLKNWRGAGATSTRVAPVRREDASPQHDAVCRRLMTVPGVGPVASLSFKVGVDDPLRFARSRTVGAHFGLTPRRHQSGTSIDYEGRITKQGDVSVREALCEAAASLLLRVKKWSALRAWGLRVAKRSSMLCAIVAVARKLAGILHRMWIDGSDFKVGFGAKVTQRLKLKPAR
jgi:transposase